MVALMTVDGSSAMFGGNNTRMVRVMVTESEQIMTTPKKKINGDGGATWFADELGLVFQHANTESTCRC